MQLCRRIPCSSQRKLLKTRAAKSTSPRNHIVLCKSGHSAGQVSPAAGGSLKEHDASMPFVPLSIAPLLGLTLPACAQEASDAAAAVAEAPATITIGPAEIFVLLSPILIYGGFNLYREKLNPRATFVDFLLIFASFAIVGNLVSILAFRQRIF